MNTEQPTMTIKSFPKCLNLSLMLRLLSNWGSGAARVALEGAQGGGRLCSAAFTARVIVRERVRVAAGGRAARRQLDQRRRLSSACAPPSEPAAACNTPLLPSRRHFSLVVRRFPRCLLQHQLQEQQQQSAINIKCATKSSLTCDEI